MSVNLAELGEQLAAEQQPVYKLPSPPWVMSSLGPDGSFSAHIHATEPYECVMTKPNDFLMRPVQVPEPSGLLLAGCLVLAALGRNR